MIIFIYFLFISSVFAGDIKSITEKEILKNFETTAKIEIEKFYLDEINTIEIEKKVSQRFFNDFVYFWQVFENDSLAGIAMLDNVYGKSMPITFLTLFDHSGEIISVRIVKYRESIGGEVESSYWLGQFVGKTGDDEFKVGQEIDAISGATISVHAITKGVKKLTLLFPYILQKVN